jgi:hypothetical protein
MDQFRFQVGQQNDLVVNREFFTDDLVLDFNVDLGRARVTVNQGDNRLDDVSKKFEDLFFDQQFVEEEGQRDRTLWEDIRVNQGIEELLEEFEDILEDTDEVQSLGQELFEDEIARKEKELVKSDERILHNLLSYNKVEKVQICLDSANTGNDSIFFN